PHPLWCSRVRTLTFGCYDQVPRIFDYLTLNRPSDQLSPRTPAAIFRRDSHINVSLSRSPKFARTHSVMPFGPSAAFTGVAIPVEAHLPSPCPGRKSFIYRFYADSPSKSFI